MAWGGINVVKSGTQIGFIARLLDDVGGILASGSATVKLFEVQDDMTLKSYDFNDNTFKTTALTTATLALTHRTGNNSTQATGRWTARLTTLTGFTVGNQYEVMVEHASASPPVLNLYFQYGGQEGDGVVQTGDAYARIGAAGVGLTDITGRLSPIVTKTGTVVSDGANSATTFVTDLTESTTDYWKDSFIRLTSGVLINQVKKITGYNGTTKAITTAGFTGTPAAGVTFEIVND